MAGTTRLRTLEDCEDFVNGSTWLGTGGGGTYEIALEMLSNALEAGLRLEWVDIESIDDDVWTATFSVHGSLAPKTQETLDEIEHIGLIDELGDTCVNEAIKQLEDHMGLKFGCLIPSEMGPEAAAQPLVVGAQMGLPVVDGDYIGRGVPEETQSTYSLYGKQSNFFASVDRWGNKTIVKHAANAHSLERIAKMLALAAFGETAVATTPLVAREVKKILVRGTYSKCLAIGRALRSARGNGQDPVDAGLDAAGGWRLFEGRVSEVEAGTVKGYWVGSVKLEGTGKYLGQSLEVWFKNENLVSWLDGKPWICSPDLLVLVHPDGHGIYNTDFQPGQELVAIGMKGVEDFRTEQGLKLASPRYFGFDIDYVPIEELVTG